MRISLLGPLQATTDGGRTIVPPGRQSLLLAVLAVNAGQVVSADRLIDTVWPEAGPGDPAGALQGRISKLRASIGRDRIVQQGPGYVLDVEPGLVDSHRFEGYAAEGHRLLDAGDLAAARAAFEAGLGLWRGPALEGLDSPWAAAEAGRLEERRLSALEGRLTADLESGHGAALVGELEQLVAEHPFRERFRAQLMVALYRAGRQADALRVFNEGRAVLADELGLDPGVELQRLQAQILEHDPALLPAESSSRSRAGSSPGAGRTRVLVVDDDPLVRSAVSSILLAEGDLEVVGEASDGEAAVRLAGDLDPDVVLMDVRMAGMDGIEATRRLVASREEDGPRVVVLTTFEQDEHVYRALQAGASGFLLKRTDPQRLPEAVRTVARGDAIIDPSVTRRLLHTFATAAANGEAAGRPHETLTAEERSVFDLMARGLSDPEIGASLGVDTGMVAAHVASVLRKLGVRDRTQAVVYAYRHGLVAEA